MERFPFLKFYKETVVLKSLNEIFAFKNPLHTKDFD